MNLGFIPTLSVGDRGKDRGDPIPVSGTDAPNRKIRGPEYYNFRGRSGNIGFIPTISLGDRGKDPGDPLPVSGTDAPNREIREPL